MSEKEGMHIPVLETMQELSTAIQNELYKPLPLLGWKEKTVFDEGQQKEVPATDSRGKPILEEVIETYWVRCPTAEEFEKLRYEVFERFFMNIRPADPCNCYKKYLIWKRTEGNLRNLVATLKSLKNSPKKWVPGETPATIKESIEDAQSQLDQTRGQLLRWKEPPTPPKTLKKKMCTFCGGQIPVPLSTAFGNEGVLHPVCEVLFKKSWKEIKSRFLLTTPKYIYMHLMSWAIGVPEGLPDPYRLFLTDLAEMFRLLWQEIRYVMLPQQPTTETEQTPETVPEILPESAVN